MNLTGHYQELLMEATVSPEVRQKTATIVQGTGKKKRYRFPMPDVEHARLALSMLDRANDLSEEEKATIRKRAEKMIADAKS